MSLATTIRNVVCVPVHPKGWPFVGLAAVSALALFALADEAGYLGLIALAFCVYFFRNPNRQVPQGEGFVLATGDGVVSHISRTTLPKEFHADGTLYHKISIFLNVFNVHVNRIPATGHITQHHYIPGKFINAALDKASTDNERTVTLMQTANGQTIGFAQIAGLVARRIICDIQPKQEVVQGHRYGIIRFGSRCDIYIPESYALTVSVGSVCVGGETILAIDPDVFNASQLQWKTV